MKRATSISLIAIPFIACKKINANEAELVFRALNTTMGEIADKTIELDQDHVEFTETISTTWEGSIEASAERSLSGNKLIYPLRVHLTQVYVPEQHITMEGSLSVGLAYLLDPTDSQSWDIELTIGGDLTVTNDANGLADIQYGSIESYDFATDRVSFSTSGMINNHDVSQW